MQMARSAAVLLFAAIAVAAESPSGATPAAPPAEDSIAAAKRDLEAIKAARGMTAPPQTAVPSFTAPALHIESPGPQRMELPRPAAEAAAAKKSANWLVDAMTAKTVRTTGEKSQRNAATAGEADVADAGENDPAERRLAAEKTERREARTHPESVVNPLAGFMADWMTPQDFKLLQSEPGAGDASGRVARGESFRVLASGEAAGTSAVGAFGRNLPGRSAAPPRGNPFLQDFAGATAPLTANRGATTAPPAATSVPPPQSVVLPPVMPAPPPPPSALPAFVKPNDDAKYFKPLKRF